MKKKTHAKKRKAPKQSAMAKWQKKVTDRIPPGRPIPDRLAAQAPA